MSRKKDTASGDLFTGAVQPTARLQARAKDLVTALKLVRKFAGGEKKVGEGRIKTQPGYFSLAGEGLCVGRDSGEAVTDDYPGTSPHRFTGGTIKRVAVDVSGEPYLDLERQAQAMLARE